MESVGYYNGEIGPMEDLKVPFLDRVSFFGDGVYDATITSNGVILFEEDHFDRFFNSCAGVRIDLGMSREELSAILHELVAKVDASDTFLYWQVTRGTAPRNHAFPEGVKPNLWAFVVPSPPQTLDWDFTAITVEDTRFLHCNIKTLNLLPNVMAMQQAQEAGVDESIFVRDGKVTECAHSNVQILKDGVLIAHPADNLILPGIARKHLIAACKELGIPVDERPFGRDELFEADEVVISMSDTFARGVCSIDGKSVGGRDRKTLKRLQDCLQAEFDRYIQENAAH